MKSGFRLVKPDDVVIDGLPCAGITIRAGGKTLGRLKGFVTEGAQQRIRYLIVRASGFFAKSTLVPFVDPRIDVFARTIDVDVDAYAVWQFRNFSPRHVLST